eukprot:6209521-Pleurochrysis_carterae.AAC.1
MIAAQDRTIDAYGVQAAEASGSTLKVKLRLSHVFVDRGCCKESEFTDVARKMLKKSGRGRVKFRKCAMVLNVISGVYYDARSLIAKFKPGLSNAMGSYLSTVYH